MIQLLSLFIIHSSPFDEVAQGPKPPSKMEDFSLKGGKTVLVTQVRFTGNQAIPTHQLERLVQQYENTLLNESDLQEIQHRVALLYQSKGYPDVKVSIPRKQASGTLTVVIVEGKRRADRQSLN